MGKCRCDSKPCAGGCPCSKAGTLCTAACHMGKPWDSVPCLNTEAGLKVKPLKPAEIRLALCDAGLSPIGDKSELLKRLAIHYSKKGGGGSGGGGGGEEEKASEGDKSANEDLMKVIMAHEGEYVFVLSLSGKMVAATSSKAELRRAYLMVSTKVHPDKNAGSTNATKAFQVLVESFERLANPEKFEEEEDDGPAGKRKKTERFVRGNSGCFVTKIKCPRCKDKWRTNDLGLEDSAYNFLMQGIKQYICGICFAKFGCMTALHTCPHCNKSFEYDPDDYHRQISCGNVKCKKTFGFWMFKVSERREIEIRKEVKDDNEAVSTKRAQQKRRAARMDKRVDSVDVSEDVRVKEQLFLLKLVDNCPRCGWELERGMKREDAEEHLESCNDTKAIKEHQKKVKEDAARAAKKESQQESQEEVMAYKTWEHNGRQVGQLWMLGEVTVRKECEKLGLSTDGTKSQLIATLSKKIRDGERKMLTMGSSTSGQRHDITPIHKVDDEDLPKNMESMDGEELKCVAASYGLDFDSKDVKVDLVKKLEKARNTGRGLLMLEDKGGYGDVDSDEDDDYNPTEDD